MVKIGDVVLKLVGQSPFLIEALGEELVNISSLARKIQPAVEQELRKPVQMGALVMAIKRMPHGELFSIDRQMRQFFKKLTDISVKSNLLDYTYLNSESLLQQQVKLLEVISQQPKFYTFSQGTSETTIIVTDSLKSVVEDLFRNEKLLNRLENLSAITLMLPSENQELYGLYYYILKEMAWNAINLVELISTTNEFTMILQESDSHKAFEVLMAMRRR